jgi:hypothetical protein
MIISCIKDYVSKKHLDTYATEVCGLGRNEAAPLGVSGSFEEKRRLWCQEWLFSGTMNSRS